MNNQQKYETAILQRMASFSTYIQRTNETEKEAIERVYDELRVGLMFLEYAGDHEELGEEIGIYLEPGIEPDYKPDAFDPAINFEGNGTSYEGP
ncbi:MAG: hypothetical protein ACI9LV_000380 [Candidatus Nanohaloarchaea archaeon]|jgi:hypothetical protein